MMTQGASSATVILKRDKKIAIFNRQCYTVYGFRKKTYGKCKKIIEEVK